VVPVCASNEDKFSLSANVDVSSKCDLSAICHVMSRLEWHVQLFQMQDADGFGATFQTLVLLARELLFCLLHPQCHHLGWWQEEDH
jgi:hypothetical protein